ncbi:MAG: hypothetical protein J7K36_07990 [Archaeoglobaceae archaeon]|nr:hypothetical protein [Archaeoglobaceae archaeon]
MQSVNVEQKYSYRHDITHYVLSKDDKIVGTIWKNVDIDGLSIGSIIQTNWSVKAELIYNGEVVGQLYLEGSPIGWQNSAWSQ